MEMQNSKYQQLYNYYKVQAKYHYEQYMKYLYYLKYYQWQIYHAHYRNVSSEIYKKISSEMGQSSYQDVSCNDNSMVVSDNCQNSSAKNRKTHKHKKRKRVRKHKLNEKVATKNINMEYEESDEEEFELDVGFQEFLKQSAEFRKERDEAKKRQEDNEMVDATDVPEESIEYVDVLRKGPDGTHLPPTAVNRKLLYEAKYDTKGTTILSLETALQWKFNKFTDMHSPKLWPAIPLKF